MNTVVTASRQTILDEILDPFVDCLTPEVSKRIVSLGLNAQTQEHVDRFALKANAGTLTAEEQAEYEEFVEAMDLIAIVKAKIRSKLLAQE